ncbi:glycosyltransferase family 87 protein [Enhygromyxa salina]|uniref:DUF2029 domain-containing protein n=1 Tax=Enhygromyxa salina TaxID=215803 RepID=A0A2S9YVK1_9BACT|nr:glycosyltransferase family 87 protein [Enhygromyxa salina]PRQ09116.1 hypothetical protein ENSA7_11060 [Enhygromyxa salina]
MLDGAAADLQAGPPRERLAFAAVWALILAPVVAHGLWRPLIVGLGSSGEAGWITIAALVVAAAAVVGRWIGPARAWLGWGIPGAAAILAAPVVGQTGPGVVAAGVALLAVAGSTCAALPIMIERTPRQLDGLAGRKRWATGLVVVLGLLAIVQTARVSTFIGDPERADSSALPFLDRYNYHACMTAYVQAAKLADARVDNLYDADWWPSVGHTPTGEAQAEAYAPFDLDAYAYPPQFLLAPRLVTALSDDFSVQRALWFGAGGVWLAFGLWFVAGWIGETDARAGIRALLLGPLIWGAPPIMVTLQVGNVHMAVVVAAVVGMIAFERERPALGGALLAFAILAKISPGLLGIVLLAQRRWREALWTAGFGLGWTLLALLVFGLAPFEAFVGYELPRLSSGEALEFFTVSPEEIASNLAPFGLPFKLEVLGLAIDDVWASAAMIGTVFTLGAVGLSVGAGLRGGDRRVHVGLWLAVLTLGGLRSPFAPPYVGFAALWLLSLWAAEVRGARGVVAIVVGFVLLLGVPPMPAVAMVSVSMVQQLALLGLVVWFIVRPRRRQARAMS